MIKDVDENDPIPLWRTASIGSIPHPGNVVPLLYSIQVNLKVCTLSFLSVADEMG